MIYAFGDYQLNTDVHELTCGGSPVSVEPQTFAVLRTLVENHDTVVTRDDLVLVHFSGHGVEIDGDNYLLPADVPKPKSGRKDAVKYESIGFRRLISQISETGARTLYTRADGRELPLREFTRPL